MDNNRPRGGRSLSNVGLLLPSSPDEVGIVCQLSCICATWVSHMPCLCLCVCMCVCVSPFIELADLSSATDSCSFPANTHEYARNAQQDGWEGRYAGPSGVAGTCRCCCCCRS